MAPTAPTPPEITMTEEHWRVFAGSYDGETPTRLYDDYTADSFEAIEQVLIDAENDFAHRADELELRALLTMAVWDTSDGDAEDLLLTVDLPGGLQLCQIVAIERFAPEMVGYDAARATLTVLVDVHNQLIRQLNELAGAAVAAAAHDLHTRITERIEHADGSWPGPDLASLVTDWLTEHGVTVTDPMVGRDETAEGATE